MKQRKPPGTGHVRTRTTKAGEVRHQVIVKVGGKQRVLVTGTKELADSHLAAWHLQQSNAGKFVPTDSGVLTVRKVGYLYLESISETTRETSKSRWKARVEDFAEFIDWPITQVSEQHVRKWIDKTCRTPIATGKSAGEKPKRQTVQNALNLLRDVFRFALVEEFIRTNPAVGVTIRSSTVAKPRGRDASEFDYLHEDEVLRLLESKELPKKQRVAFTLLAFTGARPKDLYKLTWDRVDVVGKTVSYRSHKKGKDYLVHLLPRAHDVLIEWWMAHGRPGRGLVFSGPSGKPHTKGYDWGWADSEPTPGNRVSGYRSRSGIRRPIALYSLRHSCASHLLLGTNLFTGGRTWSAEEIASQLGHSDLSTVRRYMVALGIASKRAVEESRKLLNVGDKR